MMLRRVHILLISIGPLLPGACLATYQLRQIESQGTCRHLHAFLDIK